MAARIDAAMPAEEIGRRARVPGCQVDTCFLWSIANFPLVGRKVFAAARPVARHARAPAPHPRLLGPGRPRVPRRRRHPPGVGHRHGHAVRRRDDRRAARRRRRGRRPRRPRPHQAVQRHARQLPVPALLRHPGRLRRHRPVRRCPGQPDRTLLVRDFYRLGHERLLVVRRLRRRARTRTSPPPSCSRAASFRVTDFGTSNHTPEDYLDRVVGFAPVTRPTAAHRARCGRCPSTSSTAIVAAVRTAQSAHYRNIAAMDREEKIRCGAYVYFTFLRPFAERRRASPTTSTGPCPATCPSWSSSCSTPMEGDNSAAARRRRPTTTEYP